MKWTYKNALTTTFMSLMVFKAHAALPQYTATDLGTLGGSFSTAYGINGSGQVVGVSSTPDNVASHAFVTGPNGNGMIDLGTLGGSGSRANGINASGQVVGYANTSGNAASDAFISSQNGLMDLGSLGGIFMNAQGINATGQVVGYSFSGNTRTAFISDNNGVGLRSLGTLGGAFSEAAVINATGQVVGNAATSNNQTHAFITGANGAGMTDLGTLGGTYSKARGINDSGQVVGQADTGNSSGGLHAFITGINGIGMTDLGTLTDSFAGATSEAFGINASGQVVGSAWAGTSSSGHESTPIYHAFITGPNGVGMTDLNVLVALSNGGYLMQAYGINDSGQIIANDNLNHAYLLTVAPVPVPAAGWLFGSSLVIGLFRVPHRRRAA
jgi:probable HAF family extracellular repeat protein